MGSTPTKRPEVMARIRSRGKPDTRAGVGVSVGFGFPDSRLPLCGGVVRIPASTTTHLHLN